MIESHGRGGHKWHVKKDLKKFLYFPVRDTQSIAQENGCGFGYRTNVTVKKFSFGCLNYSLVALRAEGLVVFEVGNECAWPQNDIFLQMIFEFFKGSQIRAGTVRAFFRSRHIYRFVNMIRLSAGPPWMPFRRTTFLVFFWSINPAAPVI
jgi:hypothetical protein